MIFLEAVEYDIVRFLDEVEVKKFQGKQLDNLCDVIEEILQTNGHKFQCFKEVTSDEETEEDIPPPSFCTARKLADFRPKNCTNTFRK